MTVDFSMRKTPEYRIATRTLAGRWPGDKALGAEFQAIVAWAKKHGVKTGKWFFREFGEDETPEAEWKWEMGIEVKGPGVKGGDGVTLKTLPATTVAAVTFDPDAVSPRVIYHGMADWLRAREKAGEYKEAGPYREVYLGDPWGSKRAWSSTQIQVPVRRLKG